MCYTGIKYSVKIIVKSLFLNKYPEWVCKKEYNTQAFRRFNERPVEYGFVFKKLSELYPKTILDVGSGMTALPHIMYTCGSVVTATDDITKNRAKGVINRHFYIIDDDITKTNLSSKYDLITCISVLEHIPDYNAAVKNMFKLLNPEGHLILTFPYNETTYINNVYKLSDSSYGKDNPYITQSFSGREVEQWIRENNATIIDQEYWQYWTGEYWTTGKQIIPPKKVTSKEKHQHSCILFRKNKV